MRDIILTVLVFGTAPFIFKRTYLGVIVFTWLAYFNPHKATYSFARQLPFSQVIGGITLVAWIFNPREAKRPPSCAATYIWIAFILWMVLTTFFAVESEIAGVQIEKVMKIQLFALLTVIVTTSWERVRALVWCIVLSLGFFGVKGGISVLLSGGSKIVWGPEGTFIEGNNELALALLMSIPLAYFLYYTERRKWVRRLLLVSMWLIAFSVAGSFSRGAMLAGAAMTMFLVWRSRNRFSVAAIVAALVLGIVSVMPQKWFDRAETIQTYQQDGSALKRLNTWAFARSFVADHPVLGGGFEVFQSEEAYKRYAPRSDLGWIGQDAHSIYFKVLAEHGFPGLVLFVVFFMAVWSRAAKTIRWSNDYDRTSIQGHVGFLARMLQASLVAYAVGGSFLGLGYFDLPFNIAGLCIVISTTVQRSLAGVAPGQQGRDTTLIETSPSHSVARLGS